MEKREYQSPKMEVIEMAPCGCLLQGSVDRPLKSIRIFIDEDDDYGSSDD